MLNTLQYIRLAPVWTRSRSVISDGVQKATGEASEWGGSTHVQRVLVHDDMGHAVCHQTTGVT